LGGAEEVDEFKDSAEIDFAMVAARCDGGNFDAMIADH
jgi:hypothetical protein